MKLYKAFSSVSLLTLGTALQCNAALVTFDDNPLSTNSFFDPQANTSFTSGGITFDHSWNNTYSCCWGNFTYSNRTDTTTAGFINQRSAITGDGAGSGQDNYAVSFGANAYINFDQATQVDNIDITNTTFSYLSMLNGDAFAKQFEAGDFFRLSINGLDHLGQVTGSVLFSLAEGVNIVNQWETVDLSSLGIIHGLSFDYSSSDVGAFGINTPTYFALDNISYQEVPSPSPTMAFIFALTALIYKKDRRTARK